MLRSSQEKTQNTCSPHTNEEMLLSHMQVKPPIAWGKLTHERWLQLDDTVNSKLTNTRTLSEKLNHLESTICADAATRFGHSLPPNPNLAGQSCGTKLSINLIKKKNLLLAQIKSSCLPEKKIILDHLLLHIRSKIRSLRKAEKSRKRHWSLKMAPMISNVILTRLVNLSFTPSALFL